MQKEQLLEISQQIKVSVTSQYVTKIDDKGTPLYVFSYTITITNNSSYSVTLASRYWLITNGEGEQSEVSGEGVVGEQPTILPNASYQYSSGCHLTTPVGTMQGHYVMHTSNQEKLNVSIPLFQLSQPYSIH
ncbi:Co2+/Mg2+ efflux protein ApaG [Thalassotalea ganghwensis]